MLVLLLMMSVGFAAGKLGVMTQQGNHCLSVLINKVTMPCLLLHASVSGERVLGNGDVLLLTGALFCGLRASHCAGKALPAGAASGAGGRRRV